MNVSWQIKRQVEETALNAWPALNVVLYDGWLLRFARGYTKRANSVNGLYEGVLPIAEKIDFCETQYRNQGLPVIFRLTPFIDPEQLDSLLEKRGYRLVDPTQVQLLQLNSHSPSMGDDVHILPTKEGLASWLEIFHHLNPGRRDVETHEQLLRQVTGEICLMVLENGKKAVACGLGILANGILGLFDIVTAEGQRRKGYGMALTRSLLAWGMGQGARYAYLQVMENNGPARKLYARLGFADIYRYWYRIKPESVKVAV